MLSGCDLRFHAVRDDIYSPSMPRNIGMERLTDRARQLVEPPATLWPLMVAGDLPGHAGTELLKNSAAVDFVSRSHSNSKPTVVASFIRIQLAKSQFSWSVSQGLALHILTTASTL